MSGAANIDGTGNALDNTLTGNAGDNILDGGVGADSMVGGFGNDTYVVDNVGDVVTESAQRGHRHGAVVDRLRARDANVENLTLTGTANITGTGNSADNTLIGNIGDNTLDGGAGADTLTGGARQRHLCRRQRRRRRSSRAPAEAPIPYSRR